MNWQSHLLQAVPSAHSGFLYRARGVPVAALYNHARKSNKRLVLTGICHKAQPSRFVSGRALSPSSPMSTDIMTMTLAQCSTTFMLRAQQYLCYAFVSVQKRQASVHICEVVLLCVLIQVMADVCSVVKHMCYLTCRTRTIPALCHEVCQTVKHACYSHCRMHNLSCLCCTKLILV